MKAATREGHPASYPGGGARPEGSSAQARLSLFMGGVAEWPRFCAGHSLLFMAAPMPPRSALGNWTPMRASRRPTALLQKKRSGTFGSCQPQTAADVPQSDLRTRFSSWSSDCDASCWGAPPPPSFTPASLPHPPISGCQLPAPCPWQLASIASHRLAARQHPQNGGPKTARRPMQRSCGAAPKEPPWGGPRRPAI